MTRTGRAPDLCRHAPEPYVEIHPDDAAAAGVQSGALTRVQTSQGEAVVVAKVTANVRRGELFMPMHWTDAFAPSGRSNVLISGDRDPQSGQPEFKHSPARARPYRETWRGFFIAGEAWSAPERAELVWRRTPDHACQVHQFAGRGDATERQTVQHLLSAGAAGEAITFSDPGSSSFRAAWLKDGRLERVLFITAGGRLPSTDWLAGLFAEDVLSDDQRLTLLTGLPMRGAVARGPVVCACKQVSAVQIQSAIAAGAQSVEAVGAATCAGVTCGSCIPDIRRLLAASTDLAKETRHAA